MFYVGDKVELIHLNNILYLDTEHTRYLKTPNYMYPPRKVYTVIALSEQSDELFPASNGEYSNNCIIKYNQFLVFTRTENLRRV